MRILFDFLSPGINYTCKRFFSDPEQINDAIQHTMLKVFAKLHLFDPKKGNLEPWVYRITVNEALQIIRKNNRRQIHELLDGDDSQDTPIEFDQKLEASEILEIINELDGNYRIVFNLFFVEGYSHKEIAELLGIKESSSRIFYLRAKKKLREIYSNL